MVEPTAPPTAPAPAPTTAPGGPATRKPPVPPRPAPARTAQPPTATEATIANTNFMGVSPEREDYRPQPLKVGESRRARRLALNVLPRNWKAGACRRNTYAPASVHPVRAAANAANEINTDSEDWCGREESNLHGLCPQRPQRCASTYSATTAWEFPRFLPRDMAVSRPHCKAASRGLAALANMACGCKASLKALVWAPLLLRLPFDRLRHTFRRNPRSSRG
jgi:hypothetical protein